jgi:hypothetical protein
LFDGAAIVISALFGLGFGSASFDPAQGQVTIQEDVADVGSNDKDQDGRIEQRIFQGGFRIRLWIGVHAMLLVEGSFSHIGGGFHVTRDCDLGLGR